VISAEPPASRVSLRGRRHRPQADGGGPQAWQQAGRREPPAPAGDQHDPGECGHQGEDEQQLTGRRQLERLRQLVASQAEEDHQEDQVSDGSHKGVDSDRRDACSG
jgi:hypothetical protein